MERAHSAREAVEIVGQLIDKYGYATYGGNSHFFADSQEGWVLIDFAGGKGLWVAERIGPDEIRMSYPGYVLDIPQDFQKYPAKYRGSANFISFAVEQGWFDPRGGKPFNVNAIYQGGRGRSPTVKVIEERLRNKAKASMGRSRTFGRESPNRISTCCGWPQPAPSRRHSFPIGSAWTKYCRSTAGIAT